MNPIRSRTIDIAKGILIILVVCGHCGIFEQKIYLFHMAAFFIISGYTINPKYFNGKSELFLFIKKRVKSLWLPYIAVNIPLILLHNAFIRLNIYAADESFILVQGIGNQYGIKSFYSLKDIIINTVKCLLFCHSEQLAGTTWFLRTLFITSVVFVILQYGINRVINNKLGKIKLAFIPCVIGIAMLMIGFYFEFEQLGIPSTVISLARQLFYTYVLIAIGLSAKQFDMVDFIDEHKTVSMLIMFVSAIPIMLYQGNIALGNNQIINPFLFLLLSISGTSMVLCISSLAPKGSIIEKGLLVAGKNSLSIMIWHLFAFKLVHIIQILFYSFPNIYLACFPTLKTEPKFWSIVYLTVGVFVPLALNTVYKSVVSNISARQ